MATRKGLGLVMPCRNGPPGDIVCRVGVKRALRRTLPGSKDGEAGRHMPEKGEKRRDGAPIIVLATFMGREAWTCWRTRCRLGELVDNPRGE